MKKQQSKRAFRQLSDGDTYSTIGQSNHDVQTKSRHRMMYRGTPSDNPTQVIYAQVDMDTLQENIARKVRSEVDNVMTTVETGVQDAVSTAIENLVTSGVELAMKPTNASSRRSVDANVLEPDQRNFSGDIKDIQMTASSRIHSHTDLNGIGGTCGTITVEEGDLLVNEKNIDRQTHTNHTSVMFIVITFNFYIQHKFSKNLF